jgi:tetratricopeptide (TPR) repeat protein
MSGRGALRAGSALVALGLLSTETPRGALADDMLAPQHVSAAFWRHARDPEAARAEALVRQGRALLVPALRVSFLLGKDASVQRRVGIENALSRFERARELTPNDPELLFLSGRALAAWQREAGAASEHKSAEAIENFLALRAIDPWYEAETVAFELGILYTREARFRDAQAEYERALRLRLEVDGDSAVLGNLAEVTMLAGDLERSVRLYERAVAEGSSDQRLLSLWGLAVALDRLGERSRAIESAQEALRSDQQPLQVLEQGGVFFVPAHERLYYRGLGLLAQAQLAAGAQLGPTELPRLNLDLERVGAELLVQLGRAARDAAQLRPTARAPELDRALAELQARASGVLKRRAQRAVPGTGGDARRTEAAERAAQSLTALLDSLSSFVRYASAAGEDGPWSADARAHIEELETALRRLELRSAPP